MDDLIDMKQMPDGSWSPVFPSKATRPSKASRPPSRKPPKQPPRQASGFRGATVAAPPQAWPSAAAVGARPASAPAMEGGADMVPCTTCGKPTDTGVAVPILGAVPMCPLCSGLASFAAWAIKNGG